MGHVKTMNFPFETNGKLMILGVPILKHFRVFIRAGDFIRFEDLGFTVLSLTDRAHRLSARRKPEYRKILNIGTCMSEQTV